MQHPRPIKAVAGVLSAALVLCAAPSVAAAASVFSSQVQRTDDLGATIETTYTLQAAPGEANRVSVYVEQGHVVFADTGAPMTAAQGCRIDTALVRCALAGDQQRLLLKTGDGADTVEIGDLQDPRRRVSVRLGAGDDVLTVASQARVSAGGNAGDDRMTTGPGGGALAGDAGRDVLTGASGRDDLSGGAGADVIRAGKGNDAVTLDARDRLARACGAGRDTVLGPLVSSRLAPKDCEQTIIGSILEFRLRPVAISRFSVSFKAVVATQGTARLRMRDRAGRTLGTASAGNADRRIVFRLTARGKLVTRGRTRLRVSIVQVDPRAGRGARFVAAVR